MFEISTPPVDVISNFAPEYSVQVVGKVRAIAKEFVSNGKQADVKAIAHRLEHLAWEMQRVIGGPRALDTGKIDPRILQSVKAIWNQEKDKVWAVAQSEGGKNPLDLWIKPEVKQAFISEIKTLIHEVRATKNIDKFAIGESLREIALRLQKYLLGRKANTITQVDQRVLAAVYKIWNTEKDKAEGRNPDAAATLAKEKIVYTHCINCGGLLRENMRLCANCRAPIPGKGGSLPDGYQQLFNPILENHRVPKLQSYDKASLPSDSPEDRIIAPKRLSVTGSSFSKLDRNYRPETVNIAELTGGFTVGGSASSTEVRVNAATTRGDRENNEDMLMVTHITLSDGTEIGLVRLWDGMGGEDAGDKASKQLAEAELLYLSQLSDRELTRIKAEAMQRRVEFGCLLMDYALQGTQKIGKAGLDIERSGATVTGGWILDGKFIVGTRGDSRTYVERDGSLVLRSNDHTLVRRLVNLGVITEAEAVNHPRGNVVIANALNAAEEMDNSIAGPMSNVDFNITSITLQKGDVIHIMCDGVSHAFPKADAAVGTYLHSLAEVPAQKVVSEVARGSGDNDTYVRVTVM